MHKITMGQYLAQSWQAGKVQAEYYKRLAEAGFELGEGAMHDCLEVSSQEQADQVDRIFEEVCEELMPCSRKPS